MRIDMNPTDTYGNFKIRPGLFLENGASIVPGGVNFTIHSTGAKSCSPVLYHSHEHEPFVVIPFPESYRIDSVFAMIVFDKCLLDPYAKLVSGRNVWGVEPDWNKPFQYRSKIILDDFDREGDVPLKMPHNELIIYEAHANLTATNC